MNITLLTTSRGRKEPVKRLLESLRNQTWRDFTLLLGDQNPGNDLTTILAEYKNDFPIVRIPLKPTGLSSARNTLMPHITGDIVALTDDDCWYAPDALQKVAEFFMQHTDVSVLLGNPNGHLSSESTSALGRYAVFSQCPSWVIFMRANVMRKVGQFNTALGIGSSTPWQSGEETDYLLRSIDFYPKGIKRDKNVIVYHDAVLPPTKKVRDYATGRMYLLYKHDLPLWFKLLNVVYPLFVLPRDMLCYGMLALSYRWAMFTGRLCAWWQLFCKRSKPD